jgi:hypothetical protein
MKFWQGFTYVHRESWAFCLACPLIVAIPIVAELLQHAVEMHVGLYIGPDEAEAAADDKLRLYTGFAKTLALSIIMYSVIRFLAGGRDGQAARTLEPRPVKLFALVFALQALLTFLSLFVFSGGDPISIGYAVFGFLFMPLVVRFAAAAPLGHLITPQTSIRQMWRQLPWSLAFNVVAVLPLMVAHYALGIGAIYVPGEGLKWAMLVLDSVLVGWLAALLSAVIWVLAIRKDPPAQLTGHATSVRA